MAWTDALSSEGPALPIALALMRMGGRSAQPHNLGNELTTAMQQYQQMKQQQQAAQLRDLQMQQLKMGLLKNKQTEQYGQDYLNSANPQDPNLRYLAQTNPGALAELLAKQKIQQDQANAEMARFGLGVTQSAGAPNGASSIQDMPFDTKAPPTMPQTMPFDTNAPAVQPTPLAGAMASQGPVGNFVGDPRQIASEIMKIKDPAERINALQALNQQFYPQQGQQSQQSQQGGMLPSIDKDKAFMMSMSQVPSVAAAGKVLLKHYEDQQKFEDLANLRRDLQNNQLEASKQAQADRIAAMKQAQADRLAAMQSNQVPTEKRTPEYKSAITQIQNQSKNLDQMNQLEDDLNRWSNLNANTTTGNIAGRRPISFNPDYQEMLKIQNRLAMTNVRPGQGQVSNIERKYITGGGPNVLNEPETNQRIVTVMKSAIQNERDRLDFNQQWLQDHNSLLGADKAWQEYLDKNPNYIQEKSTNNLIPNPTKQNWVNYFTGKSTSNNQSGKPTVSNW